MAKTLCYPRRGPRFDPWLGNEIPPESSDGTTKDPPCHNKDLKQPNKEIIIFLKKKEEGRENKRERRPEPISEVFPTLETSIHHLYSACQCRRHKRCRFDP